MLLVFTMLFANVPYSFAQGDENAGQFVVMKDEKPLLENIDVELLDGDQIIDTITLKNSMGSVKKYNVGKVYALRIKNNDDLELVTPYAKIVKDNGITS